MPLRNRRAHGEPPRTRADADGVFFSYDPTEYAAWQAGGPAPTPRRSQESPMHATPGRHSPVPTRRGAALFRRASFARQQSAVRRGLAVGLVLISVGGAVLWGGGGVEAWRSLSPTWWGVVGALALQLACTLGQWVFGGPSWWNPLYLLALCASTLTTVLGYWPLTHPWLTAQIAALTAGGAAAYYAPWIAGGIIAAAAVSADWLPEQVLLD
jgi:hypothetical protein